MHFRNLNASRVVQEASIVTHDVELEKLRIQRQIEDASADIVGQLDSSRRESFDLYLRRLFLAPFAAAIDCNELQLVAQRIAVLVNTMIHVRALGYSLTRDQVLVIYGILYPGGPVDFLSNPNFVHCQLVGKETDYENFEAAFLASTLVSNGGDGPCITVSDHVYHHSQYGVANFPDPSEVKAILDGLERYVTP